MQRSLIGDLVGRLRKGSAHGCEKVAAARFKTKVQALIAVLEADPLQNPPPYEKLVGDLSGAYSRRINIQHRLVYEVFVQERIVRVLRMWTHYE